MCQLMSKIKLKIFKVPTMEGMQCEKAGGVQGGT
jgi:hypothetical protein